MVLEYTNSASTGKVYIYGFTLISQGNSLYYIYNAHGDVVKYMNSAGTVLKSYDYDAFGEEVNASASDANPFRYAGQYFDSETGTYYLRARYYSPALGRFTQQDAWGYGDPTDPLSLNLYVYCYDNPLLYYVPGSYVGKGVKLLEKTDDALDAVRAFSKVDNITDAAKVFADNHASIVGSYKDIKKTVKALGLKGYEVHHLIEKRFAKTLGISNTDDILSVALDKDVHKQITKALRDKIPYDTILKKGTSAASAQDVWNALVETYTEMNLTEYIPQLK